MDPNYYDMHRVSERMSQEAQRHMNAEAIKRVGEAASNGSLQNAVNNAPNLGGLVKGALVIGAMFLGVNLTD